MYDQILLKEIYKDHEKEIVFIQSGDQLSISKSKPNENVTKSFFISIRSIMKDVFLPQGFPDSVHPDYIPYQIWDTVQAFASTIIGTLTTHSIMKGVGVGEAAATPLAAAITWILKDGTGMVGRIVFAWWNGTELDGQCKKWRLFADILNDVAMGIELLIPYVSPYSVLILCTSTAMKSIVGVAGGATRAALTQHQALRNNLADVSAKDGSQETCVNLVASLFGIFILSIFHNGNYLLELYLILVSIHLYANYSAVKALCLNSLNEDRLALIIKNYLLNEEVPSPREVNKEESVFLFSKPARDICGFDIKIGVSLTNIIKNKIISYDKAGFILKHFQYKKYLIVVDLKKRKINVILSRDADNNDILRAYFHSCLCGIFICMSLKWPIMLLLKNNVGNNIPHILTRVWLLSKAYTHYDHCKLSSLTVESVCETDSITFGLYETFLTKLHNKGWSLEDILLPTDAWRALWKDCK